MDIPLIRRSRQVATSQGLFVLAAAILVMNLVDGIMTLAAVTIGAAREANPLMNISLGWGSVWFILVKTSLVSGGVWILWQRRHKRMAHAAFVGLTALYVGILVYHVQSVESVLRLVV